MCIPLKSGFGTKMTFRQLEDWIGTLDETQKDCFITILDSRRSEYYGLTGVGIAEEDDILNERNPYLRIDDL